MCQTSTFYNHVMCGDINFACRVNFFFSVTISNYRLLCLLTIVINDSSTDSLIKPHHISISFSLIAVHENNALWFGSSMETKEPLLPSLRAKHAMFFVWPSHDDRRNTVGSLPGWFLWWFSIGGRPICPWKREEQLLIFSWG
jgi:hypothetical protein